MSSFIKMKSTQRRAILAKFLDLNVFDEMYSASRSDALELKGMLSTVPDQDWDQTILEKRSFIEEQEKVQEEVIKQRADFGIALDGDGDRVVLIDRKGRVLDGDDIMYILAYANPNRTGPWSGIIGTAMSNFGFEEAVKKLGYKFKRADVGDKHVNQMLKKEGWMLGGEPSGHIICRDLVSTGDGTIAALKVISSLLLLEKKPSEILSNYTKIPQINIAVPVSNKDIVNDKDLKNLIKEIESDMTIGRLLVRPSGTESKIRIMVEASEKQVAKKFAADIEKLIKSKL